MDPAGVSYRRLPSGNKVDIKTQPFNRATFRCLCVYMSGGNITIILWFGTSSINVCLCQVSQLWRERGSLSSTLKYDYYNRY